MTFNELVDAVAVSNNISEAKARKLLHLFADTMREQVLAAKTVHLVQLGTFRIAAYRARIGTHPTTGQPISIPAQEYVRYTPAPELRDAIN